MSQIENVDIKRSIHKTMVELFSSMLSIDISSKEEMTDKGLDGNRYVGAIYYTGEVVGVLSFHVSREFALIMAGKMLGVESDKIKSDAEVKDVLGEITNMLSGNLNAEFAKFNINCIISTPSMTIGSNFKIENMEATFDQNFVFGYENHDILIEVCLKEERVDDDFFQKGEKLSREEIEEKINSVDINQSVINSVIDVYYTMLSMEIEKIEDIEEPFSERDRIVGSVSFAGDVDGLFNIQVDENFAKIMTAAMLGMNIEDIQGDEEVHDVIREMSNIIGGNLKSGFVDAGLSCQLSTPSITKGTHFKIESLRISKLERFLFQSGDSFILIEAGVRREKVDVSKMTAASAIKAVEKKEEIRKIPELISSVEQSVQDQDSEKEKQGIDFIMDIPLEVTVELGRTRKKINDLLKMGEGTVLELEQLEGELVDILVNQTLIARGEVVVQKEKYGIRILEILSRKERFKHIK